MNELDGEEYAVVTVNLNHPMQSDSMAFLDENNYPGIGTWIEEQGLGINIRVWEQSGFCRYPLFMLSTEKL
jgi:hypothetical protein